LGTTCSFFQYFSVFLSFLGVVNSAGKFKALSYLIITGKADCDIVWGIFLFLGLAGVPTGVWILYYIIFAISDDIRPDWAQHISLFRTGFGDFDEPADIYF
jgi:hypothetical protein